MSLRNSSVKVLTYDSHHYRPLCIPISVLLFIYSGVPALTASTKKLSQASESVGKTTRFPRSPEAQAARQALFAETQRLDSEARTLYDAGDLVGAEQSCLQSLAVAPIINGERRYLHTTPLLLGDIKLRQGKYQAALQYYLPEQSNTWRASDINLDVALCYVRLKNYAMAKQYYSDRAILQYSLVKQGDLPGTHNLRSLEASILLARGLSDFYSGRKQEAFLNLSQASRLSSRNGLISYFAGMSLVHLNRNRDASAYFSQAAQWGQGRIVEEARRHITGRPVPTSY